MDPAFFSSEILLVWVKIEEGEFILFLDEIALKKDEFQSSGPQPEMVGSPSKFCLELVGTLLPLHLL